MGYKIKEVREAKGMTQQDLEGKSGVCRATIARLESEKSFVTTTKTLLKLAEALGVSIDQIFFADNA